VRHRTSHSARLAIVLCVPLLALAACGDADPSSAPAAAAAIPSRGPLLLPTAQGVAAVGANSGTVAYEAPGAKASPDGSVVVRAVVRADGTTRLTWLDPVDGHPTARVRLDGRATIRVVAADGRVAVGAPDVPVTGLIHPVPRTQSPVTVAAPDGTVRTYTLPGSVEPEAFSTDGSGLFVLSYTPAGNPTEYQVNRLDLESGEVGGVYGQDSADERQERMGGTARTQVWAPDGRAVYTLYTQEVDGEPTSFIHVLNLDEGWAFCLDLPEPLGWNTQAALAVAPDGDRLWVTEGAGHGAVVDTAALEVLATGTFASPGEYGLAAVADGDRLFVGSESEIAVLDGTDLHEVARWRTTRPIIALRRDDLEGALVAVTDGQLTTFPLHAPERDPAGRDLPYTSPLVVIDPTLPVAECAC
jgi:hypothetical protein